MAWRIDEFLVRGEIDNRARGRVTGASGLRVAKNRWCSTLPVMRGATSPGDG